jgi:dTDP-4-dehydrorhamnose reductase
MSGLSPSPAAGQAPSRGPVLVTGAGGRLGGRLATLLSPRFRVVAGVRSAGAPSGLATQAIDLTDPRSVEAALDATAARAVVHCAALADADACERDPDAARRANVSASEVLARACAARDVRLVAISTDQVFSGERPFWREEDAARPTSAYGRTKREGEDAVLGLCPGSAVARVALLVGVVHGRHPSASESIAWALRAGRPLQLFTDQFRTPIDPESVAQAVASLLHRHAGGVFHLGGPERISRHELGMRVAGLLGLDPRGIRGVRQADLAFDAPRAADASLDSSRARAALGWEPRPVDEAIRAGRPGPD